MHFPKPLPGGGHETLASNTVVEMAIPARARIARVVPSTAVRYTLGGTDPSSTVGFPLSAATHDIVVAGDSLKFYETGGAGRVYVEFFGADRMPTPVRIKGAHEHISIAADDDDVHTLTTDARAQATHIRLRPSNSILFTTDGEDPTDDKGIRIAGNTNVMIPIARGTLKLIRGSNTATRVDIQAFENRLSEGDIYHEGVSYPLGAFYVDTEDADVINVAVPMNARWAWISAQDQGIKYTTNGEDPTATNEGFSVGANGQTRVPVAGGTSNLRIIRQAAGAKASVMFFGK